MNQKTYLNVCGLVFLVIAVAHLTRLVVGWDVTLAGSSVPRWISLPGLAFSGFLSASGFALANRV